MKQSNADRLGTLLGFLSGTVFILTGILWPAEFSNIALWLESTGDAESFAEVCSAVPIPVLIAGGSRGTSFTELLRIVEQSISAGGAGVCMGRQVFGADDPASHIRALKSVIHEGMSAAEVAEHLR